MRKIFALLILSVGSLPGWAAPLVPTPEMPFAGRVVEATTSNPISNAVVTLTWETKNPKESYPNESVLTRVMERQAVTDKNGAFNFPPANKPAALPAAARDASHLQVRLNIFAAGYATAEEQTRGAALKPTETRSQTGALWTGSGGVFKLTPLKGSQASARQIDEWYEHLHTAVAHANAAGAPNDIASQWDLFALFAHTCGEIGKSGHVNQTCVKGQSEFFGVQDTSSQPIVRDVPPVSTHSLPPQVPKVITIPPQQRTSTGLMRPNSNP